MPSNVKLLAGASGGEPTDANFKNVTLLLHGDGSNGAQNNTFIDSSTNNFTITRNGNTTQGSFSPYGSNWSNYFDGSGDYLTAPSNAAFAFGTGDFTVEFWFNAATYRSSGGYFSCMLALGNFSDSPYFRINHDGRLTAGITATNEYYTTSTVSTNSWMHFAVTRQGSTVRLFVNGVLENTQTNSTNLANSTAVHIGTSAWQVVNETFTGYISNIRILKGTALYTSNFTPSTTPLTAITNTSLLTCAYNRFRDGSTNNFTITSNGDVKVTNFAPFAPSSAYSTTTNGGSAYFDGSGDYLSASSNTAFAFGTGDFAVECWVYRLNSNGTGLFESRGGSAGFLWYIDGSNQYPRFYDQNTAAHFTGTVTVPVGAWTHLAVTRSSGTLYFWVNGQAAGSNAYTVNVGSTATLRFYASNDAAAYLGYGSNMRAVKGSAVYTAAFTPPSSPVTAITNTSLLLNATNAAIFDNSMKNDIETVGNAQISTSVKKFGTGSIAFDGSGDYLRSPSIPDIDLGSGDFTIELWLNVPSVSSQQGIIVKRNTETTGSGTWGLRINSGGSLYFEDITNSTGIVTFGTLSTNTWTHVAVTRSGSTVRGFLNGSLISSGTSTRDFTNSFVLNIGFWGTASGSIQDALNGYIDDLRITKGIARYTANFTAPTAPFPNK